MPGITRIHIIQESDYLKDRLGIAQIHEESLNSIYRSVFPNLDAGDEVLVVTKDEAKARYDFQEGIDLILTTSDGLKMTVQEKLLTTAFRTVTFEEKKSSGALGGWYYGTSQLYMVAYNRNFPNIVKIDDYMLLNFTSLKVADSLGQIKWRFNCNKNQGRLEQFRYLFFDQVPKSCIVSQWIKEVPLVDNFLPF